MKANELQIGDWVLWGEPHSNIDGDYDLTFGAHTITMADFAWLYQKDWEDNEELEFVKPIQLDEEILLANGFEKSYTDNQNAHYSRSGVGVTLNLASYTTTIMGKLIVLHYVHELQHALRLCGLNDLADNFKVE